MKDNRITVLKWYDILILTIILFGHGIYNSTIQYIALKNNVLTLDDTLTFTSAINYQALVTQSILLFVAFIYLLIRNFDFSIFYKKIRITPWLIPQIIGVFVVAAFAMDIYYILTYSFGIRAIPSMFEIFSKMDISLILYSLLNGFYEEIFFLGICLAVKPEHTKWAFLYSLIIRCSFHTYQGLTTALGLGIILGSIFYFLYKKIKPENLLPFFLAHSIADIIGLSVIFYFLT